MLNIATIGTSWITDSFIKSAFHVDGVSVMAVYSRTQARAKEFATEHNIEKFYCSLDEMLLDDEIDAVYIASPNAFHFEHAMKCLEYGKHVICEKPAVVTYEQLKKIYETAEKKNLIFLEAMKSIHSDGLPVIKEEMKNLGDIRTACFDFSQLSSKYPSYKRGEIPNIFNPAMCAGGLMDLGVYAVYVAVELFGKPEKIISHCDFLNTGADFSGTVIFVYDSTTVTVTYSKVANGFTHSRITGENGAVTFKSVSKLIDVKRIYNDGTVKQLLPDIDENIVMSKEIKDFMKYTCGEDSDGYAYCRNMSIIVCEILEQIRKENNFIF